jgi:hypothetical protein
MAHPPDQATVTMSAIRRACPDMCDRAAKEVEEIIRDLVHEVKREAFADLASLLCREND